MNTPAPKTEATAKKKKSADAPATYAEAEKAIAEAQATVDALTLQINDLTKKRAAENKRHRSLMGVGITLKMKEGKKAA